MLRHSTLPQQLLGKPWSTLGENVGFGATSAIAQSSGVLEEVVVTARKRVESLQDVPVAVTAITADQLLRNNATDLSKLAELAPQVVIGEYGTGTGAVLTIRGISSAPVDAGLEHDRSRRCE